MHTILTVLHPDTQVFSVEVFTTLPKIFTQGTRRSNRSLFTCSKSKNYYIYMCVCVLVFTKRKQLPLNLFCLNE